MAGLARLFRWLFRLAFLAVALVGAAAVYDSTQPPVSTLMAARWLTGKPVDRRWVPLSGIAPSLVAAVVMSEDGQFCAHRGVDWDQLSDVMNGKGPPSRGASTITMQTTKNLFLWPGRSYLRKALEIPSALALDAVWSKPQILGAYLNIAEWGDGIYGVEAAAQIYFKKPASQLSVREATLLATALPNPFLRNPLHPSRIQRALAARLTRRVAAAAPWLTCLHEPSRL